MYSIIIDSNVDTGVSPSKWIMYIGFQALFGLFNIAMDFVGCSILGDPV